MVLPTLYNVPSVFILFVSLCRVMEWLQTRFAEASPEPFTEDTKTTELANLQKETMKNKKRIKSMMAMLEAQNRLLTRLALTIDPSFELPEDTEETRRTDETDAKDDTDGKDATDDGNPPSPESGKENEEPVDDTSVELAGD